MAIHLSLTLAHTYDYSKIFRFPFTYSLVDTPFVSIIIHMQTEKEMLIYSSCLILK